MQTTTDAVQKILDSRRIPEGYYLSQSETPTRVYFKESNGKFYSLGFRGRAINSSFNYVFRTEEDREKHLNSFFRSINEDSVRKVARKSQQQQPSVLKVGDILYTSWGYDQTNIDFFQVIKTSGIRTVDLVRINSRRIESLSDYTDNLMPMKDSFITEGYQSKENGTYRVKNGNTVSINGYKNAWLWDGKSKNQTAPGYGH